MEPYEIRFATSSDLPAVIDLAVEAVTHSTSPYRTTPSDDVQRYRRDDLQGLYQAMEDPNFRCLVAIDGELKIIGHVLVHCGNRDSATGSDQAWVYDLSVRPGLWNAGVGKALMRAAEDFAISKGMHAIGLGVTLSNERAVSFYRKLGYLDERIQMIKQI